MAESVKRRAKSLLLAMGFSQECIQEHYRVAFGTGEFTVTMVGISDSSRQAVQCENLDLLKILQLKRAFDKVWILTENEMFQVNVSKNMLDLGYDGLVDEYLELAKRYRELEQKWNLIGKTRDVRKREFLQIRCTKGTREMFRKFAVENRLEYDKAIDFLVSIANDKQLVEKTLLEAKLSQKADIAVVPFKEP